MKPVTSNVQPQTTTQSAIVDALFDIGSDWARQGIGMGIAAVRTQASLFRTLSTTLEHAADAIAAAAKPMTDAPADTAAHATSGSDVIDTTATGTN